MKKQPKIIKLEIEDNYLSGVDAISFVESPAIEIDFMAFSKQIEQFETYNDYPESMVNAAKRGIELNKENNQKCATQVGKVRAQQLANRENLSLDTIRRMRAFLIRQKDNYDLATKNKTYDACGYISYLLWGGEAGIGWAEKKLRQAGEEFDLALEIPDYSNEVNEDDINNFIFEKIVEIEIEKDSWIDDLTDDIEDAVESALLNVGISDQDLIDAGYDLSSAVEVDAKETFVASVSEIKRASQIDKPSVDDFGDKQVLYRYMRYDGTQSFGDNSRKFCQNVINAGMWFRKEDINKLTIQGANPGLGLNGSRLYDIFTYKGGRNCQHYWQAIQFTRDIKATEKVKPLAVLDRIVDATSLNPDSLTNLIAQGRLGFSKDEDGRTTNRSYTYNGSK
jgi:hypothetical protein